MKNNHWAAQQERGNRLVLKLSVGLVRYLPAWLLPPVVAIISTYYYLTGKDVRQNIARYHQHLLSTYPDVVLPKMAIYRQIYSFAQAISDRFAVWQGRITYQDLTIEDPDGIYQRMRERNQRGEIFLCCHHGNMEICRALVNHHQNFHLNVLVHSKHAEMFNQALKLAGASDIRLIQVSELDAALMLTLKQSIECGEWLAIAIDRVPVHGGKIVTVPFLGKNAPFSQGALLLAGLLKTRVNCLFCTKINGRYRLRLENFAAEIKWQKNTRQKVIFTHASRYAERLAQECRIAPLQWFNFYDFWAENA